MTTLSVLRSVAGQTLLLQTDTPGWYRYRVWDPTSHNVAAAGFLNLPASLAVDGPILPVGSVGYVDRVVWGWDATALRPTEAAWGQPPTASFTATVPPPPPPPPVTGPVTPAECGPRVGATPSDTTDANGVRTINDTTFTAAGQQQAFRNTSGKKVIFNNCRFAGYYPTCALWGDNLEVNFCEFSGFGDGMKLGNHVHVYRSWFHDCNPAPGDHSDGIQMQDGIVDASIVQCRIDMGVNIGNSALFICPDMGPTTDGPVKIDSNYLAGGNYTLCVLDGSNGTYFVHNITVTNNVLGAGVWRYGPTHINVPVTASGNTLSDGTALTI